MAISNTETELILAGIEPPIDSILIDGQLVDFAAYDGSLESTTAGTTYTLSLSGYDNQEDAFFDNASPTANAGPDQSVAAATQFTLDGTGSQDTDGTIIEYRWTQTAGDTVTLDLENPALTARDPT